jgi:hypothetical protein
MNRLNVRPRYVKLSSQEGKNVFSLKEEIAIKDEHRFETQIEETSSLVN